MKKALICLWAAFFLIGLSIFAAAAEKGDNTSDKGVAAAIADDAREVKKEAVKIYHESKEAIVRDVKEIKEDVPKALKETKGAAVQKSKEIKESARQELQEIRANMAKPAPKTKTEGP